MADHRLQSSGEAERSPGVLGGIRAALAHRIDRWLGPLGDEAASDHNCLAAETLWWDPRVLPRTSSAFDR